MTDLKRRVAACLLALGIAAGTTACGKEVDRNRVGATKVQGTYNLWWFCDATTLIYFEDNGAGDDEYTLIWPGACTAEGKQKDMSNADGQTANEPGGDN